MTLAARSLPVFDAMRRDLARGALIDLDAEPRRILLQEFERLAHQGRAPRLAFDRLAERADAMRLAYDNTTVKKRADRLAAECMELADLYDARDIAAEYGIEPPNAKTEDGEYARLCCPKWWRRQLRVTYTRQAEAEWRERGQVHRRAQPYCTDAAVHRRRSRKHAQRDLFAEILAVNELGDVVPMLDLINASVANPVNRRAELMTRIRGFEEVATAAGHVGEFLTITTPSRFHAMHSTGHPNTKYEGGNTPRESQAWLCAAWARIRAAWAREDIRPYGFRIAEPHHDGTTHWHLLLFLPPDQLERARTIARDYLLADAPTEAGAQEHRFKAVKIDTGKGTAAGYCAKYVAKNIDGYEVGLDWEAVRPAIETAERVDAWAATWGIRQFQQIGGPPVGVWRELRRVREPVEGNADAEAMEAARLAADAGDWAAFIGALGGYAVRRSGPVQLAKYDAHQDVNEYGEPLASIVFGLRCNALVIETRSHIWMFMWADRVGLVASRTCVNNCTPDFALYYANLFIVPAKTGPPR